MKLNIYSLIVFCLLTSCYTYRSVDEKKESQDVALTKKSTPKVRVPENANMVVSDVSQEVQSKMQRVRSKAIKQQNAAQEDNQTSDLKGIYAKLLPSNSYKIKVDKKQYKIQVDRWEGDSLIAHVYKRPEKKLKFNKNQIDEQSILERKFSQPISDIITVTAYAGVIALVLLLVL